MGEVFIEAIDKKVRAKSTAETSGLGAFPQPSRIIKRVFFDINLVLCKDSKWPRILGDLMKSNLSLAAKTFALHEGIVYRSTGSWYWVKSSTGDFYDCRIKGKFRLQGIKHTNPIAVGDRVQFSLYSEEKPPKAP